MMAPNPVSVPSLEIPSSRETVKVSIIDSTTRLKGLPSSLFFVPEFSSYKTFSAPAFSFLIEHGPSKGKVIFDLGVRKDIENHPPQTRSLIKDWDLRVEKNVADILQDNGMDLSEIKAIIWSHRHFDHTGDPSVFPSSTDLVVGPGFSEAVGPGYPHKQDSSCVATAWEGRRLIELDFDVHRGATKVGRYKAIDWFGDGSFYLLQTPGHTNDHMCGFARTKLAAGGDEFILMGGDIAHHGGELRPTEYTPIPDQIAPDPRRPPFTGSVCPGELFANLNKLREGDDKWKRPFLKPSESMPDSFEQAEWSLDVLEEFDAQDNVLVILAHDDTLWNILEFYPTEATEWKQKGWKEEGRWRFMNDYIEPK